ncbi:MAG: hypothetical protein V2B18_10360 [Pseudomonadota bacterium]
MNVRSQPRGHADYIPMWPFAAASVVLSLLIALGMRFINEDLFVAFCAGRDVLEGKLGEPDTWSFVSGGIVWVNQAWLSHLALFLSYKWLGSPGPVLVKTALLLFCTALLYARLRRPGTGPTASLTAISLGLLSVAPFLQIRGENFGVFCFLLFSARVTAPRAWGTARYVGALFVLGLWTNCHGSFVLFFVFTALKAVVETVREVHPWGLPVGSVAEPDAAPSADSTSSAWTRRVPREGLSWLLTLLLGIPTAAFLNPFGPSNLFMPHQQLTTEAMTRISADWLPLLDWGLLWETDFFRPMDVKPYLLVLFVLVTLSALSVRGRGRDALGAERGHQEEANRPDLLMEALIVLVLVALSFRFRRIIVFAGFALVPALGVVSQRCVVVLRERAASVSGGPLSLLMRHAPAIAISAMVLATAWIFFRTTVPPYLPSCPMRPDRPLADQLMSFDSYDMDVVRFLTRNQIGGRVLAGWMSADFLYFHVPGIKIFLDCRDQSAYSPEVIRSYFSMLDAPDAGPAARAQVLERLDYYRVDTVVLDASPPESDLATLLMTSKKWVCVFAGSKVFVLVRADTALFGKIIGGAEPAVYEYPDDRARIRTYAVFSYFQHGSLPTDLRQSLKTMMQQKPDPSMYTLLYLTGRDSKGRLTPDDRSYLLSEVDRLSKLDPMLENMARPLLGSLTTILSLLEADARAGGLPARAGAYAPLRRVFEEGLYRIEQRYLGSTPQEKPGR